MEGLIFNIQRFSIHDGPGIRTTVFMKGCSLSCLWCHNPESISGKAQVQFYQQKCIGCGACLAVCPHAGADPAAIERTLCTACGRCCDACPAQARTMAGKFYTPESCCEVVLRDRDFYRSSGGGATFSGGEPLLQADFVAACFELLAREGVSPAVDTAGCVPWSAFEKVIKYRPLFLFDLKHPDEAAHRQATGASNNTIFNNLRMLAETGCEIWIRIPLIPGFNDSPECVAAFAEMIKTAGVSHVDLMPMHRLGSSKYASLGLEERCTAQAPDEAGIARVIGCFSDTGIQAQRG